MGKPGALVARAVGDELGRRLRSVRWLVLLIVYVLGLVATTLLAFALAAAVSALAGGASFGDQDRATSTAALMARTLPSWWAGLLVRGALAALLVVGGWRRLRAREGGPASGHGAG